LSRPSICFSAEMSSSRRWPFTCRRTRGAARQQQRRACAHAPQRASRKRYARLLLPMAPSGAPAAAARPNALKQLSGAARGNAN
jgi:hypothetical protein